MPKHHRRFARRGYRGPYGPERFHFDVDMLLLEVFSFRHLDDGTADRIMERAQREAEFRGGLIRQKVRTHLLRGDLLASALED